MAVDGKHAIDYITSFDRTRTAADVCEGLAGTCDTGVFDSFIVPKPDFGGNTQASLRYDLLTDAERTVKVFADTGRTVTIDQSSVQYITQEAFGGTTSKTTLEFEFTVTDGVDVGVDVGPANNEGVVLG